MPERRLLDATELFAALPEDVLDELRERATIRTHDRKGELLFTQGDTAGELFVVARGPHRDRDAGRRRARVDGRGARERRLFGELACSTARPAPPTPGRSPSPSVVALAYEPVRAVLQARPELLWVIVRLLAQRLRATDEALADAVFLDVPARTAKRLLELAGDDDEFQLPMTQEDLAGLVGASRERVNKALAMFARLGWVEVTAAAATRSSTARPTLELRPESASPAAAAQHRRRCGARRRVPPASRQSTPRNAQDARPGVGGVVGAVRRALGVVHEAVVGVRRRRRSRSRRGRATRRAARRCRPAGVHGSSRAEDRERRAHLRRGVERLARLRAAPVLGHADHPVERDRAVEATGGRGLERVHPAHAEPEDRRRRVTSSWTTRKSAARSRSPSCSVVVDVLHVRHARHRVSRVAHVGGSAANGSGAHDREAVRGEPAAQIVEERPDPMMSGCTHERRRPACPRAGRGSRRQACRHPLRATNRSTAASCGPSASAPIRYT